MEFFSFFLNCFLQVLLYRIRLYWWCHTRWSQTKTLCRIPMSNFIIPMIVIIGFPYYILIQCLKNYDWLDSSILTCEFISSLTLGLDKIFSNFVKQTKFLRIISSPRVCPCCHSAIIGDPWNSYLLGLYGDPWRFFLDRRKSISIFCAFS